MPRPQHLLRKLWLAPCLGLAVLALPIHAPNATELPLDPLVGRYNRMVRSLEAQAAADPAGAARAAARARRDLVNRGGGAALRPELRRIDVQLTQIERLPPAAPPGPPTRRERPPAADLPASHAQDPRALPSMRREMQLLGRLLDRAAGGIRDRNTAQARSDLAAAEPTLAALRAAAAPAAQIGPLGERYDRLRREAAALPVDADPENTLGPELQVPNAAARDEDE